MKESVITMLEELKKEMESMKLNEICDANKDCNVGIDTCIRVIKRKIAHIKQEVQA